MNLIGLIDITAQTLSIVKKNSKPSDLLALDFLKSKRTLGSNDRRFISELLFFTLRNLNLIEHISNQAITYANKELNVYFEFSKNSQVAAKTNDFINIIIALILAKSPHFIDYIQLEQYLNKKELEESSTLELLIEEILMFQFKMTKDNYNNWIKKINYLFILINNSFSIDIINNSNINLNECNNYLLRYSFPEWIAQDLLKFSSLSIHNIFQLAKAFTKKAPITLRINSRVKSKEDIIETLNSEGIETIEGTLSPTAVHISKRVYFSEHSLYRTGAIEIQDEASQLVSYALAPEENWKILDACAGAGGKSIHLAALQNDNGLIIATDKEFNRLKEISRRASNGGFNSIHSYLIDKSGKPNIKDGNIKFFDRRCFSAVLVDAPCSGIGTLRREPMKKYRTTRRLIEKLSNTQLDILTHYSQYLNIGGILIYATCSIMPQENQQVVERFLNNNPQFKPDNLFDAFSKYDIIIPGLKKNDHCFTFYPHLFGTDGFFIARMKKI